MRDLDPSELDLVGGGCGWRWGAKKQAIIKKIVAARRAKSCKPAPDCDPAPVCEPAPEPEYC